MFEFDEPKETRLAKLSLAGVTGFEGGFEEPERPDSGVDLPERGVGRMVVKSEPELTGGGLLASFELVVQLRPLKSSMRARV